MVYKASNMPTVPIPAEPMILHTMLNNADNANVIVYVPWKSCKLVFAYTVVTTAIDAGGCVLTLELNAAGGSAMYTITVAGSAPVGAIDEGTKPASISYETWDANRGQLDRSNTSRDAINIDINGDASPAGTMWLTMYFEHDYSVGGV
jgi:hypothetical protein